MTQKQLKVFVNYRRADEKIFVELLRTHFMFRYGQPNVFMDFDSIPEFRDFEEFIKEKVRESDVITVMIGKRWLELLREKEARGEPDYVRLELEEAIKHGKVIAPICLRGASMPDPKDLPDSLRPIAKYHAPELSEGIHLQSYINRVMNAFEAELAPRGAAREVANPDSQAQVEAAQDASGAINIDEVMDRFAEAFEANDVAQALFWLGQLRNSQQTIPSFFGLDRRETELQERLREEEDRRRRREVADFQFKFVRRMLRLNDPPERIAAAVREIWQVDDSFVPDDLLAIIRDITFSDFAKYASRSSVPKLLPQPFQWVPVPVGKVTLLNDWDNKVIYLKRNQRQTVAVSNFAITKYPITNAQYEKFIQAGGYDEQKWWTNTGWELRRKDGWTEPRYWNNKQWNGTHYPVVGVSWYEAMAFCAWLSDVSGETITLPTEQQWQRAAQGDDERVYPWGKDWNCRRCNNSVSPCDSNSTMPVTQYEGDDKGDSPYGVTDMVGNVWEWCLTAYISGTQYVNGTDDRVVRGGSWDFTDPMLLRATLRNWFRPDVGSYYVGFRCARSY